MIPRGLTLLETLLALSLLGVLSIAGVGLLATATRGLGPRAGEHAWELAAREAMGRMADDLLIGDALPELPERRAEWRRSALVIRTRAILGGGGAPTRLAGAVVYRHDRERQCLLREVAGGQGFVPILGDVAEFLAVVDPDGVVHVTLRGARGRELVRRLDPR